jgi:hypothetical protein
VEGTEHRRPREQKHANVGDTGQPANLGIEQTANGPATMRCSGIRPVASCPAWSFIDLFGQDRIRALVLCDEMIVFGKGRRRIQDFPHARLALHAAPFCYR